MLADPAPARADVDALGYYRPDVRFSPAVNAERIASAQRRAAAAPSGHALAVEFDALWRAVDARVTREPTDRIVLTRHCDAMLLTDFLVTRVVELAVHGFDLAAALDRDPWTTEPAASVLEELLGAPRAARDERLTFLRKATGRLPLSPGEPPLEVRKLTLG